MSFFSSPFFSLCLFCSLSRLRRSVELRFTFQYTLPMSHTHSHQNLIRFVHSTEAMQMRKYLHSGEFVLDCVTLHDDCRVKCRQFMYCDRRTLWSNVQMFMALTNTIFILFVAQTHRRFFLSFASRSLLSLTIFPIFRCEWFASNASNWNEPKNKTLFVSQVAHVGDISRRVRKRNISNSLVVVNKTFSYTTFVCRMG